MVEAFSCAVCGSDSYREEFVEDVFHIDDQYILVDHIPAAVCNRCGDLTFSAETIEQVRVLVHGETEPAKSIPLNVFEFQHQGHATATPGH